MQDSNFIKVTEDPLDLSQLVAFVASPKAGAISTFSGTTRDNFEGRKVLSLEYEAYGPMAEKEMHKIADQIREKWPEVLKLALVHRIGRVEIGEASVVIAISSPHRVDSLHAVEYAIDEIKAVVPVWKKEFYEDGEGAWKENKECCFHKRTSEGNAETHSHSHPHHHHHHHHKETNNNH